MYFHRLVVLKHLEKHFDCKDMVGRKSQQSHQAKIKVSKNTIYYQSDGYKKLTIEKSKCFQVWKWHFRPYFGTLNLEVREKSSIFVM